MILDGNQTSVFKTTQGTIQKVLLINYTISKTDKKMYISFFLCICWKYLFAPANIKRVAQDISRHAYRPLHVKSSFLLCKCGIPTVPKMKIQIIWHTVLCWLVNSNIYFSCTPKCNYLPTDIVSRLHYRCSSLTKIGTYCYTVNELQNMKLHENTLSGYLQPLVLNISKIQSTQNKIISLVFFNIKICTNFPNIWSGFTVLHIKKYTQRQHVCMHPFMCTHAQFTERTVYIGQVCTHPKCLVTQIMKLYMVPPNICRSLLCTWFHVTLLVPRILRQLPNFFKNLWIFITVSPLSCPWAQ